jgi:hypothetical protein
MKQLQCNMHLFSGIRPTSVYVTVFILAYIKNGNFLHGRWQGVGGQAKYLPLPLDFFKRRIKIKEGNSPNINNGN